MSNDLRKLTIDEMKGISGGTDGEIMPEETNPALDPITPGDKTKPATPKN